MDLLLVEDDSRVSRFIERGLAAEGYSVSLVKTGPEALFRAREGAFDIMILDVMLPGMNGKDVCRQLRCERVATPILMLTALDHTDEKVEALRGGADDYLTKPFDFEELLARIEALCRRANKQMASPPNALAIADVRMERDSVRVFRGSTQVELTTKEFQLLELFLLSPGKVFSRTRILNKVWGYDSDPLTNVVDVYVRRLRQKLGWNAEHGCIQTVRNFGYRLDPGCDGGMVPQEAS